ncbi:RecQ family zinc-binding domain-containing protein [Mycobacterium simiae]|uniref:RecQ family zinc-binding domain-containing protein n=1 Tax=Mycobacterium simiae TaxID=1784 RepID=UPI0034A03217
MPCRTDCCTRVFLLSYFGEQLRTACGNCDIALAAGGLRCLKGFGRGRRSDAARQSGQGSKHWPDCRECGG